MKKYGKRSLSGRSFGAQRTLEEERKAQEQYEPPEFQHYQFDDGLQSRSKTNLALSPEAFGMATGDKSLGRHVERLLEDNAGLTLARSEAGPGWPW